MKKKKRNEIEMDILEALCSKEMTIDEICDITKLNIKEVSLCCVSMSIDGVIISEDKPVKTFNKVDRKIVVKTVKKTFYRI